ncbi:MAG: hypothetical protein PF542_01925 [Nanoarchaeota archaeon]|nr:hypothetical protein [Nanoarchaeota archaeon]
MNMKQKHLSLKFDESTFGIMKKRKNRYIKNHKYEKLNWEDYIKILVLCSK